MKLADVAKIRLASQQIVGTKFTTAKDLVSWMGAMQAQDYAMAKWAIGVRLPNSTDREVETAIDGGEIIRTHLLRPTWHLVSGDDVHWMLELTAPQIRASLKSRHKGLGLTESVIMKCNSLIEKALTGGKQLSRNELIALLEKAKIRNENNRAAHILLLAELDGIICSGAKKGGKQTYAILEERTPKTKALTREEALAKLATRYFTSHCPATLKDFVWWSGLSVGDAKQALEMVKWNFVSETIDSKTYWLRNSFSPPVFDGEILYLLPAFDEFIIAYANREASLISENHRKTVIGNGMFKPITVSAGGRVTGVWKRTIKKEKVIVNAEFFELPDQTTRNRIEGAFMNFGHFLEKKIEINYK